jgi:putative ABC transport system permease protein
MSAVLVKAVGDLRRRRLQSLVLLVIMLLASGTAALALTLFSQNGRAYDSAFQRQQGAHLIVGYDSRHVGPDQLQSTPGLLDAVASGGPWPNAGIRFAHGTSKFGLNLVGRPSPDGPVALLQVVSGRWLQAPGEIVITKSAADFRSISVGDQLLPLSVPDKRPLRVVGEVVDVEEAPAEVMTQSAWVVPEQVSALVGKLDLLDYQVYYRFAQAPSAADIDAFRSRLEPTLPAGAIDYFVSYLNTRQLFNITNSVILATLLAFSLFALVAVTAIVANIVMGMVVANYREIGVMKSIGFTPLQVVTVLVLQMLFPALVGCLLGVPLGTLASQPLLLRSASVLGIPPVLGISPLMDLLAFAGCLLLVALAATLPGLRAGRLSAVSAITMGSAPPTSRASWLGRQLRRLPLPLPWALGAGDAAIRPLRGAFTAAAILVGVTTITFAFGLHGTFAWSFHAAPQNGMVLVNRSEAYPESKILDTLQAQPQTQNVVAAATTHVQVPGFADPITAKVFRGDARSLFLPLDGRWFSAPGEAVAPAGVLNTAHVRIGDTIHATHEGHPVDLKIVGTVFDIDNLGQELIFDWSTYQQVVPDATAYSYTVQLRPGSDAGAYAQRVYQTEPDFLDVSVYNFAIASPSAAGDAIVIALAAVLAVIAMAGIFNTVLLNVRESVRDMAILKSLGLTPRNITAMVVATVCLLGLVACVVGIPLGVYLQRVILRVIGSFTGNDFPPQAFQVFPPVAFPVLAAVGLLLGILGSLGPARWAARSRVATILHAE